MFKKAGYLFLILILVLASVASGCGDSSKPATKSTGSLRLPARTGEITTGSKLEAINQSIGSQGGIITVAKAGDALDGLIVDVPAGAFLADSQFKISYAPITGQTFGSDINPISPMITIDNGGKSSDELIYLRVPVKVSAGYFAMGFIYDAQTRQLEGLPLIAADETSVTIGTKHFCDLFISMIDKALLKTDIDSGFRPGADDWQFTNYGSYIKPGGHCEGQSLTAMWYYSARPDGKNAGLYGRYDNNGNQPATPSLWEDDSLGYRFCSVAQAEMSNKVNKAWANLGGKGWVLADNKWKLVDLPAGFGDEVTWNLFAYSIQATAEPQLVVIWSNSGSGHAMICYRINQGNLYIADPNYPGNSERLIEYSGGKFQTYNSGANKAAIEQGKGEAYDSILYYAKSTVLTWDNLAQEWDEVKDKSIGNDNFPGYEIRYQDEKAEWIPLADGTKTNFDAISIAAFASGQQQLGLYVYRDGALVQADAKLNYDLKPGTNKLGIEILGEVNGGYKYIDFKYLKVIYEAAETTTAAAVKGSHPVITSFTGPTDLSQLKDPNATVQFSIKISGGKAPYTENWSANMQTIMEGKNLENVDIPVSRLRYNGQVWTIFLMVQDANGAQAEWIDSVGISHPEFVYGIGSGGVRLEPSIPYHAFGAK